MPATAEQLRDAGINLAITAQENHTPGWADEAYAAISRVALRQPTVHVDDVAREVEGVLPAPHHANAWGGVWRRAILRGIIRRTGDVMPAGSTYPAHAHKHARAYPVYRSEIFRG